MTREQLQEQCEAGAQLLIATQYWAAAAVLADAEAAAWAAEDYDTLARVCLPLQEARRLTRQRCGEGTVLLDQNGPATPDQLATAAACRHGQVLVAGRGSIAPGLAVRRAAEAGGDYVEAFLAAAFPTTVGGEVVVAVPLPEMPLPDPVPRPRAELLAALPPECVVLDLPSSGLWDVRGSAETFRVTMLVWERLHEPYLAAAVAEPDPVRRIERCRLTLGVDPACELAHQYLADAARSLARTRRLPRVTVPAVPGRP